MIRSISTRHLSPANSSNWSAMIRSGTQHRAKPSDSRVVGYFESSPLEFVHLVSVAAERRNNGSHGRKPVDVNFRDFPAPLRGGTEVVPPLFLRLRSIELALRAGLARKANRNHGLTPVAKVVSPLRG